MYELLLFLHLLSVVIGFGTVFLNGIYGVQAKNRQGSDGLAISEANYRVSDVAEWFIYATPVFGILMVVESEAVDWGETWIWLSLVLYVVALGISHGMLRPNVKRMLALQRELVDLAPPPAGTGGGPPAQAGELEQRGKTVATAGGILNVLLVILLALMVWKPGT
jgi:uncharacterized membrane protein